MAKTTPTKSVPNTAAKAASPAKGKTALPLADAWPIIDSIVTKTKARLAKSALPTTRSELRKLVHTTMLTVAQGESMVGRPGRQSK